MILGAHEIGYESTMCMCVFNDPFFTKLIKVIWSYYLPLQSWLAQLIELSLLFSMFYFKQSYSRVLSQRVKGELAKRGG